MGVFFSGVAGDLVSLALLYYIRGDALAQTTQNKPTLKWWEANQETFPSGLNQISEPIQGTFMQDTAGFLQGYSEDDALTFSTAANALRAVFNWKEVQTSLVISWSELKKDGITISDHQKVNDHGSDLTRLTGILKNRMGDFGESQSRAKNLMLWQDGTQDSKQTPGLRSFITDSAAVGITGGLNRATYPFWQHRVSLGIAPSGANSSLIQFLNSELLQLQRFGGGPDKAVCGSQFLDALRLELVAKGFFTQTGFGGRKATQLGIGGLHIDGLGDFEYDPTLDNLGMAKRCLILDSKRIKLRPMEGEDMKVLTPERPYNYLVFLKTVTWTLATEVTQLNANGMYSVV